MTHHIIDSVIRHEIDARCPSTTEDTDTSWKLTYKPDFYRMIGNSSYYVVEYENSSRGCVTHVAKYISIATERSDLRLVVDIIRSNHHRKHHRQDAKLAEVIAKLAPDNLSVSFPCVEDNIEDVCSFVAKRINELACS